MHPSDVYKVGQTYRTVEERLKELNQENGNPGTFEVRASFPVSDRQSAAHRAHLRLKEVGLHQKGEFFKGDWEEIFGLVKEVAKQYEVHPVVNAPKPLRSPGGPKAQRSTRFNWTSSDTIIGTIVVCFLLVAPAVTGASIYDFNTKDSITMVCIRPDPLARPCWEYGVSDFYKLRYVSPILIGDAKVLRWETERWVDWKPDIYNIFSTEYEVGDRTALKDTYIDHTATNDCSPKIAGSIFNKIKKGNRYRHWLRLNANFDSLTLTQTSRITHVNVWHAQRDQQFPHIFEFSCKKHDPK